MRRFARAGDKADGAGEPDRFLCKGPKASDRHVCGSNDVMTWMCRANLASVTNCLERYRIRSADASGHDRDRYLAAKRGVDVASAMPRFTPPSYETKFADFIRICRDSAKFGIKQVVVANPSVIGDTHDELIESRSRLAEAGLSLCITAAEARGVSPMAKPSLN